MTYWRYWGLENAPFSGESRTPIFLGATIQEAIARIEFLTTNRRALGLLVGSSGVGKSTVLRHCLAHPPTGQEIPNVQVHRQSLMGMQGGELIEQLASWLTGDRLASDNRASWKSLCDYFRAAAREGVQTLLLIDDAESASTQVVTDLGRLISMNFPLTIILAADVDLVGTLSRQLLERVELEIDLPCWDFMQTAEFLLWSSQSLGRAQPIFTEQAVRCIHQRSSGLARRVIQLADLALVAGAVSQSRFVDADCIQQVALELPKTQAA